MVKPKSKIIKVLQFAVSLIALLVLVIFFFYIKDRAENKLDTWQFKIPKNEAELKQVSEGIVAGVARSATEGAIRDSMNQGKEFFEESDIAQPARSIRDDAKNTAENLFNRLKTLPADEFKIVKQKIGETWFKTE